MTPLLLLLQARSVGLASLLTAGALACAPPPRPPPS